MPKVLRNAILGGAALLTLGVAGTAFEANRDFQDIPALHQTVENTQPFDINKLDTETQTLVFGQNARYATPEEIKSIINSPLPELKPNPKTVEDLPTISILPSIDLQKAGQVEAWRGQTGRLVGNETIPVPMNLFFSVENYGTPLGLFIPKGINTDSVEIFLMGNGLVEKFSLGKDKYILIRIGINDLTLTDAVNKAPVIDQAHPKSGISGIQDILQETGMKLTISKNPVLFTTRGVPKSEIVVNTIYGGNFQPAEPVVQDGKPLFSSPSSPR